MMRNPGISTWGNPNQRNGRIVIDSRVARFVSSVDEPPMLLMNWPRRAWEDGWPRKLGADALHGWGIVDGLKPRVRRNVWCTEAVLCMNNICAPPWRWVLFLNSRLDWRTDVQWTNISTSEARWIARIYASEVVSTKNWSKQENTGSTGMPGWRRWSRNKNW